MEVDMERRRDDPDRPWHAEVKLGPWSLRKGLKGDIFPVESRRLNMADFIPKDSIITLRKVKKD